MVARPELQDILSWLPRRRLQAQRQRHRLTLVLSGEAAWCYDHAACVAGEFSGERCLWLGDKPVPTMESIASQQALNYLGQELDLLVYDAHCGFDPDSFGALSGTLCAGGLLLLLIPPMALWPALVDANNRRLAVYPYTPEQVSGRLFSHLLQVLRSDGQCAWVEQDGEAHLPPAGQGGSTSAVKVTDTDCLTQGQADAVAAIARVVHGHRRRPLVLTSDRGRGKSAALGIAAARLLRQGMGHIVVTAPRMASVQEVFFHAQRLLPDWHFDPAGCLSLRDQRLSFVPPDELIRHPLPVDLLLVDEAAAIPVPLLTRLLARYARMVFASTVHGYEGTGRGFALRFQRHLDSAAPGWHRLHLEQPIRWAQNDPLERFVFDALVLDAAPAALGEIRPDDIAQLRIEEVDRDTLIQQPQRLRQLFALLVLAHYRTRPNDLRHLLDGPNVRIWLAGHGDDVVAVLVSLDEGGIDEELAREIYLGHRRVQGHLSAQSLANHAGIAGAPILRYRRVMRVAVHPAWQRCGIGSRLLANVRTRSEQDGFDVVCASFGADTDLMKYWRRSGFTPVHIGLSREQSSGSHAVMVLHPLSGAGNELLNQARARLSRYLIPWLSGPLRQLPSELVQALVYDLYKGGIEISKEDRQDIDSFIHGRRGYEVTQLALQVLAIDRLCHREISAQQRRLLVKKCLQNHAWSELALALGMTGKGQAQEALRQTLRDLS